MKRPKTFVPAVCVFLAVCGGAYAMDISGTIDSTLTITENSDLVGDVTCTVSGAPCISINAAAITLRLNGYTMTGMADPKMGCNGGGTGNELGILVNSQMFATIQGPGVVQQFRNSGIQLTTSTGVTVIGVTTSTNCASGILIAGGADNQLINNVSIRNGNGTSACGGI
jgi:hypothetical protein